MKKKHPQIIWICGLFLLTCIMSASAFAQSKQEVAASMRQRYPALMQAKDKGLAGEAWTGLAAVVEADAPANVRDLVQAENQDRKQLFGIIADETGTSIQEVARQNRIRMYRLAKEDHFVQNADRQWVRKKDLNL